MRKKIVAGNWKMNTTVSESEELVNAIILNLKDNQGVEKIVFPPFPFIESVNNITAANSIRVLIQAKFPRPCFIR